MQSLVARRHASGDQEARGGDSTDPELLLVRDHD